MSFIIPCYNAERYLEKCFNSIIRIVESYILDAEIILIDDGSTDETSRKCKELSVRYSNTIVLSKRNAGLSVARNDGIMVASGDWLWFIDSDDYLNSEVNRYEALFDLLNNPKRMLI